MMDEELKRVINQNQETLTDINRRLHRIEKKFFWNSIFGFVKTFIILAPIILGIIYLTPILKDYIKIFDPIFKNLPATLQNLSNASSQINTEADKSTNQSNGLESFCDTESRQAMVDQLCQ